MIGFPDFARFAAGQAVNCLVIGIAVAGLASLLLQFLQKASSALRFAILYSSLLAIVVLLFWYGTTLEPIRFRRMRQSLFPGNGRLTWWQRGLRLLCSASPGSFGVWFGCKHSGGASYASIRICFNQIFAAPAPQQSMFPVGSAYPRRLGSFARRMSFPNGH